VKRKQLRPFSDGLIRKRQQEMRNRVAKRRARLRLLKNLGLVRKREYRKRVDANKPRPTQITCWCKRCFKCHRRYYMRRWRARRRFDITPLLSKSS
jgi:hypothetical protein